MPLGIKVKRIDLEVRRGATFQLPILWEGSMLIYRQISSIANSSPIRISSAAHGIPDGWLVAVANVKGMAELNAASNPPADAEFRRATVLDANTIEFNRVNGAAFRAHMSNTGQLVFYEPMLPIVGLKARMQIKNKVGGTVLYQLTTENGGIAIDVVLKRITLDFPADAFVGAAWKTGVYDLETEDPNGVVTPILYGAFALTDEVTTII